MRPIILSKIAALLESQGFHLASFIHSNSCFDLAARRQDKTLLIKVLVNIDALRKDSALELKRVGLAFRATPIVVGLKSKAFNLQGHGGRPIPEYASMDAMADDLAANIMNSGLQKPFIFGHCWGGLAALNMLTRYPDIVSGAIFAGLRFRFDAESIAFGEYLGSEEYLAREDTFLVRTLKESHGEGWRDVIAYTTQMATNFAEIDPVDETLIEGGKTAAVPLRLFAVAAVVKNPWAGRGFVDDLGPEIRRLAPVLGEVLTSRILSLTGSGEAVEGYGKAAIVGTDGEVEHASALIHTLRFGNIFRKAVGAKSYLSFTNVRGGPGCALGRCPGRRRWPVGDLARAPREGAPPRRS